MATLRMVRLLAALALFLAGCGVENYGLQARRDLWAMVQEATVGEAVDIVEFDDDGEPLRTVTTKKVIKTDDEWRELLSDRQFEVMRRKGTERAFLNEYHNLKAPGIYRCASCGTALFTSEQKFDSGTGWPSYWEKIAAPNVITAPDNSYGMRRTEILCALCDGHLGHLFEDGPPPTGLRYCVNSVSLAFIPAE